MSPDAFTMPAAAHVGHVALRAGDVDRLVPFYRDVVGLDVARDGRNAVLSAGDAPLVVLEEDPDAPPRDDEAGLFHLAVRVPNRTALGDALRRIENGDVPGASLTGASDHLVSEALYLRDPEGNGVEIYRDRPREEWTFVGDRVEMDTLRLDLERVREAAGGGDGVPTGTDVGHVHLEVTALEPARAFYVDALGLNVRVDSYGGALFLAAGEYHHHVGLNTWNRRRSPASDSRGVEWFEFVVPTPETVDAVATSLAEAGRSVERTDNTLSVADPDGIGVRIRPAE